MDSDFTLLWVEGTEVSADASGNAFPAVFDEDYNNGSVTITAFLVGPESDYVPFAGEADADYSWWAGEGVQIVVDTDCDLAPAVLELPEITPSVCVDNEVVAAMVTAPADSDSVTYGEVTLAEDDDDAAAMSFMQVAATTATYTFTATANEGFTFEGVTMPEGWMYVSPTEAVFSITVDLAVCEIPVTPTPTPTATPAVTPTPAPTETAVTATVVPTDAPTEAAKAPAVTGLPNTGAGNDAGNGTLLWLTLAGVAMLVVASIGIRRSTVR